MSMEYYDKYGGYENYQQHYKYVDSLGERYTKFRIHLQYKINVVAYNHLISEIIDHPEYWALVNSAATDDQFYDFFKSKFEEWYVEYRNGNQLYQLNRG
jgi:hypothetical protein